MTARWVVDAVAPERNLDVEWKSISLYFKNEIDDETSPVYATHRLLRVFESVKASLGNEAAQAFYWECGRQIHHDGRRDEITPEGILEAAGIDVSHAAAADDAQTWDPVIRQAMQEGLDLAGTDIGTPIIAFENALGRQGRLLRPRHHEGAQRPGRTRPVGRLGEDIDRPWILGTQAHPHRTPRLRRPPLRLA
ncbi:MAG: hypothetical protein R2770_05430 [Acidimicrobiales bacterium]